MEKKMILPPDKNLFYGLFVKDYRHVCSLRAQALQKKLLEYNYPLSKADLNRMENGMYRKSAQTFWAFLNAFAIPFDSSLVYVSEFQDLLKAYYEQKYLNKKEEQARSIADEIESHADIYLNSFCRFSFLIWDFCQQMDELDPETFERELSYLTRLVDKSQDHAENIFTRDEAALFFFAASQYYKNPGQSAQAITLLEWARSLADGQELFCLPEMIEYAFLEHLKYWSTPYKALEHCQKLAQVFARKKCYLQALRTDHLILIYMGYCHFYQEAKHLGEQMLRQMDGMHVEEIRPVVLDTMAWVSMGCQEYEKALRQMDKAASMGADHSYSSFLRPWCLFKLGQEEQAAMLCRTMMDGALPGYETRFLKTFHAYLRGWEKTFLKESESLLAYSRRNNLWDLTDKLFELRTLYFNAHEDYKQSAAEYQSWMDYLVAIKTTC